MPEFPAVRIVSQVVHRLSPFTHEYAVMGGSTIYRGCSRPGSRVFRELPTREGMGSVGTRSGVSRYRRHFLLEQRAIRESNSGEGISRAFSHSNASSTGFGTCAISKPDNNYRGRQ